MKRTLFTLIMIVSVLPLFGQQTITGNVVEYFGKERFERTDEGIVTQKFTEGWVVPSTITTGTFFTIGDQVAWELYSGNFKNPYKGDTIANDYGGFLMTGPQRRQGTGFAQPQPKGERVVKWQKVTADSTGKLSSPTMRRGMLYVEWNNSEAGILLLQASGNGKTLINGIPHEGDSFDFGFTITPFKAVKGVNSFVFSPGRFGYVQASIVKAEKPVMFTHRDMTLPSIIKGESTDKWGGIRVINASEKELSGMTVECLLKTGESTSTAVPKIMDLSVRKIAFAVPASPEAKGKVSALLTLKDKSGKVIDTTSVILNARSPQERHERTYLARTDGSVQYYAVTPSTVAGDNQALVLSVHGAGVEARNQSRAYKQKDWVHIACATGRRPYGFNWESIGRWDALDVFEDAQRVFKTDPKRSYLTGHSMGGHGTWILGVTYPDKWAAIAPCAGYPDIATYGSRRGPGMDSSKVSALFERAANEGRALKLKNNYLQSGVYVFHGGADMVVPTSIAREMRKVLADFHPDFCYAEYPGGSHWFSDEAVDWKPIFEFFNRHSIPDPKDVRELNFSTASPSVSGKDYWLTILQQQHPFEISNVDFAFRMRNRVLKGTTDNVASLQLDVDNMPNGGKLNLELDGTPFKLDTTGKVTFIRKEDGTWATGEISTSSKNDQRGGGFKEAFNNNVVFVYATGGTKEENSWYKEKARYDAECFLYKANGSNDVISDKEFLKSDYSGRNVVLYGNAENNKAWNALLSDCPLRVASTGISMANGRQIIGDDLAVNFVYPRKGDDKSLVGVIGGTGLPGAKATMPSEYISGVNGYPDIIVYSLDALKDGVKGVRAAGYFDNDWSLDKAEFIVFE